MLPGLLVAAVLAGLIVARDPGATGTRVRELLGSNERLGEIVGIGDGDGEYAFVRTQRGSEEPVTWSPCEEIPYVVNPEGAPVGWEEIVEESVETVEEASGFVFADEGETDDRDFDRRSVAGRRTQPGAHRLGRRRRGPVRWRARSPASAAAPGRPARSGPNAS